MATTPEQNLADVCDFAPGVRARAAEIESHRRRPTDRVAALRALGVFRMVALPVPARCMRSVLVCFVLFVSFVVDRSVVT